MIKKSIGALLLIALLFMGGCSSSSVEGGEGVQGPSSGEDRGVGSLSGSEDIDTYLEGDTWETIEIDLDLYLYATKSTKKSYKMQMDFVNNKVTVLADCYNITASYRIKDDEISFSRVSSPKPAIDNPTCREFKGAENAVSAFFTSDYFVSKKTNKELTFEALDIEATVTLKR